jgi:uncharacterized iron-regulated membrane protein
MPRRPKSWLGRNWVWLLVAGLVLAFLFVAAVITGGVFLLKHVMTDNEVVRTAMAEARAHPEVVEALGEPIEPGFMPTGSIHYSNDNGSADLAIGISGPRGSGTIYVEAERQDGEWQFHKMEVALEGRAERIDLRRYDPDRY